MELIKYLPVGKLGEFVTNIIGVEILVLCEDDLDVDLCLQSLERYSVRPDHWFDHQWLCV